MRKNLIAKIRTGEDLFPGIFGYEDTVIPHIENAILAGQDIIFLGERGQAKSRIIRSLSACSMKTIPIARRLRNHRRSVTRRSRGRAATSSPTRATTADSSWIGRDHRYGEKLATPGHHDRRPDRRSGPDQSRRGQLPLGRADDPLRPYPAHEPRHLLHQRAARPCRAHPGRPAQHHGRARRADPRLPHPPAARRLSSSPAPTPRTTPTAAASSRR